MKYKAFNSCGHAMSDYALQELRVGEMRSEVRLK